MEQTIKLPRRLDKEWRRAYDKQYRIENKNKIQAQQQKYNALPHVKKHRKKIVRKWYEENREAVIAYHRELDSTIEGKIRRWKQGAKRRGIPWELTPEFVKSLPTICHYTGLPLTLEVGKVNTMSIDRVDSSKPYDPNNVVPCCSMINNMKRDYTKEEFVEMCRKVVSHNAISSSFSSS
jgi:hypothetical protein